MWPFLGMSQMKASLLEYLGYPMQVFKNNFYTAMPRSGLGVCIARMNVGAFVQFFPWESTNPSATGHERYANFITAKSTSTMAESQELFTRWPHFHVVDMDDILLIKCAVEQGLEQLEKLHATD